VASPSVQTLESHCPHSKRSSDTCKIKTPPFFYIHFLDIILFWNASKISETAHHFSFQFAAWWPVIVWCGRAPKSTVRNGQALLARNIVRKKKRLAQPAVRYPTSKAASPPLNLLTLESSRFEDRAAA
jgi:hypothetical protein